MEAAILLRKSAWKSGYVDFGAQVDVLNRVEQLYAFAHRSLERFAAGDEAGTTGALVDDGRCDCLFEIVRTRRSTGVDEASSAHITIRDLVAAEIDRMIAG